MRSPKKARTQMGGGQAGLFAYASLCIKQVLLRPWHKAKPRLSVVLHHGGPVLDATESMDPWQSLPHVASFSSHSTSSRICWLLNNTQTDATVYGWSTHTLAGQ
jgi:hypothetical protein